MDEIEGEEEDDEDISDVEFVDDKNDDQIEDEEELTETSENYIKAIQRRVNHWQKTGFRLTLNSRLFDCSISSWLKLNCSTNETPLTKITTTMTIREFSYSTTANMFDSNVVFSTPIFDAARQTTPGLTNIRIPMSLPRSRSLKPRPPAIRYNQLSPDDTRNLYFPNNNVLQPPLKKRNDDFWDNYRKPARTHVKLKKSRPGYGNKRLQHSTMYFGDQSSGETSDEDVDDEDRSSDNSSLKSENRPIVKPWTETKSDSDIKSKLLPTDDIQKFDDIPVEKINKIQQIVRLKKLQLSDSDLKTLLKFTKMDEEIINNILKMIAANTQDHKVQANVNDKENNNFGNFSLESTDKSNGNNISQVSVQ